MPPSLLGGGMASGGLGAAAPNTIIPLGMPRSLLRGGLLVKARGVPNSLLETCHQGVRVHIIVVLFCQPRVNADVVPSRHRGSIVNTFINTFAYVPRISHVLAGFAFMVEHHMVVHRSGHVKVNDYVILVGDGEVIVVLAVSPAELGLVILV